MRILAAFIVGLLAGHRPEAVPLVLCLLLWKLIDVCEKLGERE